MNLDRYIELLVKNSGTSEKTLRDLRLSLRQIPYLDLNKLLHPDPRVRLSAVKKLVQADKNAKLPVILQLLNVERDLEIRFYLRESLNLIEEDYPFWIHHEDLDKELIQKSLKNDKTKTKLLELLIRTNQTQWAKYLQQISLEVNHDRELDSTVLTLVRNCKKDYDEILLNYLQCSNETTLCEAIDVVGQMDNLNLKVYLIDLYNSASSAVNHKIENTLSLMGETELYNVIEAARKKSNQKTLINICEIIQHLEWIRGRSILQVLSENRDSKVSEKASQSIEKLNLVKNKGQLLGDQLLKVAHNIYPDGLLLQIMNDLDSRQIAMILNRVHESLLSKQRKVRILQFFLEYPDSRVRANVIESFGKLTTSKQKKWFLKYLNDPNNRIRGNAWVALIHTDLHLQLKSKLRDSLNSLILDEREMYQRTAIYCLNSSNNSMLFRDQIFPLLTSSHSVVRQRSIELAMKWNLSTEDIAHFNLNSDAFEKINNQLITLKKFRETGLLKQLQTNLLTDDVNSKQIIISQIAELPPMDFLKEILLKAWERASFPDVQIELLKVLRKQDFRMALEISKNLQPKGLSRLSCVAYSILLIDDATQYMLKIFSQWDESIPLSSESAQLLAQLIPMLSQENHFGQIKRILMHLCTSDVQFSSYWTHVLDGLPNAEEDLVLALSKFIFQLPSDHINDVLKYLKRSCSRDHLLEIMLIAIKQARINPSSPEATRIFKQI